MRIFGKETLGSFCQLEVEELSLREAQRDVLDNAGVQTNQDPGLVDRGKWLLVH